MSNQFIRIVVVDDHTLVRKSIIALLNNEPDMEVVGTAANGREAVEAAKQTSPDIIVMDISMPELDGIRAVGEIRRLGLPARIIMLSLHHSSALLQQARKNGAVDYILKQQASKELIPAIRAVHDSPLAQ